MQGVIDQRKSIKLDSCDIVKYYCCCSPNKVISNSLEFLNASLDEDVLAKQCLKLQILAKSILPSTTVKILKIPSINYGNKDIDIENDLFYEKYGFEKLDDSNANEGEYKIEDLNVKETGNRELEVDIAANVEMEDDKIRELIRLYFSSILNFILKKNHK